MLTTPSPMFDTSQGEFNRGDDADAAAAGRMRYRAHVDRVDPQFLGAFSPHREQGGAWTYGTGTMSVWVDDQGRVVHSEATADGRYRVSVEFSDHGQLPPNDLRTPRAEELPAVRAVYGMTIEACGADGARDVAEDAVTQRLTADPAVERYEILTPAEGRDPQSRWSRDALFTVVARLRDNANQTAVVDRTRTAFDRLRFAASSGAGRAYVCGVLDIDWLEVDE